VRCQDKNTETVMAAVTSVKSTEIAGVVRSLDADALDVLMKYLYAGMAAPEKYNAGSLLAWHEVVRAGSCLCVCLCVCKCLSLCVYACASVLVGTSL
jgi:hypothetical protein